MADFLPVCLLCKKICDDKGHWSEIDAYLEIHANVEFSHGMCPECADKHYPDLFKK